MSLFQGFVNNFSEENDGLVTVQYIRNGSYEVEIAGRRYPAKARLNPPPLPFHESNYNTTQYGVK